MTYSRLDGFCETAFRADRPTLQVRNIHDPDLHFDPTLPAIYWGCMPKAHTPEGPVMAGKGDLRPATLIERIREMSDAELQDWKSAFGIGDRLTAGHASLADTSGAKAHAPIATFFVEDTSLDSCAALAELILRITTRDDLHLPDTWRRHAINWEIYGLDVGPDPHLTYGVLHSALVHSAQADTMQKSWRYGFTFLIEQLQAAADPLLMTPASMGRPFATMATMALSFEERSYDASCEVAHKLQLRLPLADCEDRSFLVDAMFDTEDVIQFGSHKVFARTDNSNAELGDGFSFMALYRPSNRGSGNDITISTDARKNFSLRELWERIEAAETQAWDGTRPYDKPRHGMKYAFGDAPVPNQPWYIDEKMSLIGAPRSPCETRLDWITVRNIIWNCYSPIKGLPFSAFTPAHKKSSQQTSIKLEDIHPAERFFMKSSSGKTRPVNLYFAGWNRHSNATPQLTLHSTLKQAIAAKIARPIKDHSEFTLDEILAAPETGTLSLPHAEAILSSDGAFIIFKHPESAENHILAQQLQAEFKLVQSLHESLTNTLSKVRSSLEELGNADRLRIRDVNRIIRLLARSEIKVRSDMAQIELQELPTCVIAFRNALYVHWHIAPLIAFVEDALQETRNILTARTESHTTRRLDFITTIAVPVAFFAGFFDFLVDPKLLKSLPLSQWHHAIHWAGLSAFLACSLIGILILVALVNMNSSVDKN